MVFAIRTIWARTALIRRPERLSVQGAKVDREKWAEVQKRQQEASRKLSEAGEKFRPDMEAQLLPLLTEAQAAKYKDAIEESSDTPTGRAKSRARWDLLQYRVAELTEQQQTQVRDIMAKAYEEFDKSHPDYNEKARKVSGLVGTARAEGNTEAEKSAIAEMAKLSKEYTDAMKGTKEQVERLLTNEQRGKLKAEADRQFKQGVEHSITQVVLPLDKIGMTDEQKQKVVGLIDAARKAMSDMGPGDYGPQHELADQFKKDVLAVLTDGQREKYGKATIVWTFGGNSGPEGTASVQWKD